MAYGIYITENPSIVKLLIDLLDTFFEGLVWVILFSKIVYGEKRNDPSQKKKGKGYRKSNEMASVHTLFTNVRSFLRWDINKVNPGVVEGDGCR